MNRSPPALMQPMRRFLELQAQPQSAANDRALTFSFSSEQPVQRWFGDEVLSHAPGAADLSRLNDGAALLFNHEQSDVIGVVESARIDTAARKGVCTVRFASTPRADEVLGMVRDGILRNVSFMYRVDNYTESPDGNYTATSWTPLEVSIVTVPADPSVGIGRAHQPNPRKPTMNNPETTTTLTRSQRRALTADSLAAQAAVEEERARVAEITALAAAHKLPEGLTRSLIEDGASVQEARAAALELIQSRYRAQSAASRSMPVPEFVDPYQERGQSFSLSRAILAAATGDWRAAGYERAVSADLAKKRGKDSAGLLVPTSVLGQRDGYSTQSGPTGGALVATNLQASAFIEVLRKKSRVLQLGATVLSGLVGNVDVPRRTAAGPAQWIAEGEALTPGQGGFDVVSLRPKTVGGLSFLSRNLLLQGTPDAEMLVRADMVAQLALAIDHAALAGTGQNAEPLGVLKLPGVGSVVGGTAGAAVTFDHLIALHAQVAAANADGGQMAYLINSATLAALMRSKATTGQYLWSGLGGAQGENYAPAGTAPGAVQQGTGYSFMGLPLAVSNNVPSDLTKGAATGLSALVFGNWSDVLIGEWGVLEILPNPYAAGIYEAGAIQLRALQTIDVAVRHPQSFAVMTDAITA
ncbi:phage major capsid protein [Extensimonas perlucida]|uniref:phage major capsid protein n=1 Tax=Extensimonas perlucida TaxID=2590786 RepID=UPI001642C465|nr:phage major capsid protein [Extensimonas perlucida]